MAYNYNAYGSFFSNAEALKLARSIGSFQSTTTGGNADDLSCDGKTLSGIQTPSSVGIASPRSQTWFNGASAVLPCEASLVRTICDWRLGLDVRPADPTPSQLQGDCQSSAADEQRATKGQLGMQLLREALSFSLEEPAGMRTPSSQGASSPQLPFSFVNHSQHYVPSGAYDEQLQDYVYLTENLPTLQTPFQATALPSPTHGHLLAVSKHVSLAHAGSSPQSQEYANLYDERLQEEVYCRAPVKRTFIHFDDDGSDLDSDLSGGFMQSPVAEGRWMSAPGAMMERSFRLKLSAMQLAHARGDCKPCAYFAYKEDGCRWGEDCSFCHYCAPGELKKRKKEKAKAKKAQAISSRS